ncbi:enkurin isoform X2 [Heterodontus francisci]|uniref:enkurin isoform X2 n=1 Tax=Heterodontus francisci TaxID=7792 RepID=UPI00355B5FD7
MGLPKVEPPCPKHHLLKHSKEQKLPERKPYKVPVEGIKSSIPSERPIMGHHTKKNFVQGNIVDVKMSVPRKPVPIIVDTRRGNKMLLEPSGLLPTLLYRKDYGKIPDYLIKRTEEEKKAQEEYDAYVKERIRQGSMKMLTEDERNNVLLNKEQENYSTGTGPSALQACADPDPLSKHVAYFLRDHENGSTADMSGNHERGRNQVG